MHHGRRTKASLYDARRLLEQSLAIDQGYARAVAMLSWNHFKAYIEPFDGDYCSPAALDRALELAERAVHLDTGLPQAHAQLGQVLLFKRWYDTAIAEFKRAFALNPNYIDFRFAQVLIHAGEAARGMEVLEAYIRLDPLLPSMFSFVGNMGMANYMLKRYEDAVRLYCECASRIPNLQWPHLFWPPPVRSRDDLRRPEKRPRRCCGSTPVSRLRLETYFTCKDPKDGENMLDGQRKAGLRET